MGDIRNAFPSKYLKAADLGKSRPIVTIQNVLMEKVGDDTLPMLTMVGKDKGLLLNRTNANMIEEIAGTFETDAWRGIKIQLYATKTDYAGKRVDCIRVEAPTSAPAGRPVSLPPMPLPPPSTPPPSPSGWASVGEMAAAQTWNSAPAGSDEPLTDDDIPF